MESSRQSPSFCMDIDGHIWKSSSKQNMYCTRFAIAAKVGKANLKQDYFYLFFNEHISYKSAKVDVRFLKLSFKYWIKNRFLHFKKYGVWLPHLDVLG